MDDTLRVTPSAAGALARARALIDANRFEDAVPFLRQAVQADPESQEAHCLLGVALHFSGHSREGLKAAQDAVLLNPDDEWPYRVQATILSGMGRRKEALEAAERAASLSPDEPSVLECLARSQLGLKRWKAAGETASYLLHLAPDWDCTHELLGDLALATRRWKDAERHYRDTLGLDAQSHSAMNNLGVALQRLKRHKEAIECFHQAARINPAEKVSRENLYSAVKGYAGFGFFGVWLLIQGIRVLSALIRDLPEGQRHAAGIAGGLVLTLGAGSAWWLWRRRMRELHPNVTAFYQDQQRRSTRDSVNRIATVVFLSIGVMITTLWSVAGATEGPEQVGLTSWPLALYLLIAVSTVVGLGYQARRRWRKGP